MTKTGPSKCLPVIEEEKEVLLEKERAVSVSPIKGSQGGPEVDISSQEDSTQKEAQDIDRELIQDEDGQNSEVIEIELDRDRDNDKDVSNLELSKEGMAVITPAPKSL